MPLKLSPCVLAKIMGGTITMWDDAEIKAGDSPQPHVGEKRAKVVASPVKEGIFDRQACSSKDGRHIVRFVHGRDG